jgi:hypothetical protein
MCGASLPPLIIIPHLTRCLEDYKSFLEMSAMKFSGFAAAVKEETKRKVEPIEFGVAFGSKKLTKKFLTSHSLERKVTIHLPNYFMYLLLEKFTTFPNHTLDQQTI